MSQDLFGSSQKMLVAVGALYFFFLFFPLNLYIPIHSYGVTSVPSFGCRSKVVLDCSKIISSCLHGTSRDIFSFEFL